jgi:hypothetical protein
MVHACISLKHWAGHFDDLIMSSCVSNWIMDSKSYWILTPCTSNSSLLFKSLSIFCLRSKIENKQPIYKLQMFLLISNTIVIYKVIYFDLAHFNYSG